MKYMILSILCILFILTSIPGADATDSYLNHLYDDYGVFRACSYYELTDFNLLSGLASDTLKTESTNEVVGRLYNDVWEWEISTPYTVRVIDNITYIKRKECHIDNVTLETVCEDIYDPNISYADKVRYRREWADFNDFKALYSIDASIKGNATQIVRYCADIEREMTRNGYEISIDIIPEWDGLIYNWLNWWNQSFLCRQEIFTNITTQIPFNVNDTDAPNIFTQGTTESIYLYFEEMNCTGISAIANETDEKNWENGSSRTGNNPTDVYEVTTERVYHMDNSLVNDSSRYGNHPISFNGTSLSFISIFGNSIEFNESTNDWIDTPHFDVDATPSWTWTGWFNNVNRGVQEDDILSTNTPAHETTVNINSSGDGVAFVLYDGEFETTGAVSISPGWHHFAAIYTENTNLTLFVDGVVGGSDTVGVGTATDDGTNLIIGANSAHSSIISFTGYIDEIRIYNRSLSPTEIQEMYYNGINNLTSLGEETIKEFNTTLKAIALDINDFNFSSSAYVPAQTIFFNASMGINMTLINSMNIMKSGSASPSDVSIRIKVNDSVVHEELLRTVAGSINPPFDEGSVGMRPFTFSVPTGEHNLTIEFKRTGSGAIQINDIDFSLLQFESDNNNTIRSKITEYETSFTNTGFDDVFNWTMSKSINSSTSIITKMTITATIPSTITCRFRNLETGVISNNTIVRFVSSSSSTGSASMAVIEDEETVSHNHSLNCRTTGGTATINGSILDFDMKDNESNEISFFQVSNALTNGTNTITIGQGTNKLINDTYSISATDIGLFFISSISMGTSTGEQTPSFITNSTNINENVIFSKKERYLSDNNDIGNAFMLFSTVNITTGPNEYNLWAVVGSGETLVIYDEYLSGFEITPFDITAANLPPLPNAIIQPENNANVSGESKTIDWLDFIDPNGDVVTYKVFLSDTLIASGLAVTQTTANYTAFSDGAANITVEGCDPSAACVNVTINITIDNTRPVVNILTPVNGSVFEEITVLLSVNSSEFISSWIYSINDGTNISFVPNLTITGISGVNFLVIHALDNAGNLGTDNVTFTAIRPINTRNFCLNDDVLLMIEHEESCDDIEGENCNTTITRQRQFCDFGCSNNTLTGLGSAGCQESPISLGILTIIIVLVGAVLVKKVTA